MALKNIWDFVRNEQYGLANEAIKSEFEDLDERKGLSDRQYHQEVVQLFGLDAYNSLRSGRGEHSVIICREGRSLLNSARSVEPSLGERLQFRVLEGLALASTGSDSESIANFRNVCLRDCNYFEEFFYGLGVNDSPMHATEVAFNAYKDLMNSEDPNADIVTGILGRFAMYHEIGEWDKKDPTSHVSIPTRVNPKDLMAWASLRENHEEVNRIIHTAEWEDQSQQVI